ncbi:MAG: hypothetical protein KF773_11350 [Deltaproteobacteria bacterium]|nr:hypothetical protein [Deltaproteobacteria bacterium]
MTYTSDLSLCLRARMWTFDDASRKAVAIQTQEMARTLYALGWHPTGLPAKIVVDEAKLAPREDWLAHFLGRTRHELHVRWPDQSMFMVEPGVRDVVLHNHRATYSPRGLVDGIAKTPFTFATFHEMGFRKYPELPEGFSSARGIPGGGGPIGLGLGVKGDGHLVFVSRRWITHGGPWRVLRGAEDTSFLQLYDLGATPEVAWSQAEPGHARLYSRGGGKVGFVWLREDPERLAPKDAKHDRSHRKLWVLAGDRKVGVEEMRDVAEYRFNGTVAPERLFPPTTSTAYVFGSEERAKEHLHELWLRGHEVWFERAGERTRVDEAHDPAPPAPPAWVAEADAREAHAPARLPTDRPKSASPPPPAEASDAASEGESEADEADDGEITGDLRLR